ncbi:MAG TPA: hypothetical protein VEL76_32230 [Gemmataceae bacterium]|nr:hypothetical protein [Gemmataceae bacterium]
MKRLSVLMVALLSGPAAGGTRQALAVKVQLDGDKATVTVAFNHTGKPGDPPVFTGVRMYRYEVPGGKGPTPVGWQGKERRHVVVAGAKHAYFPAEVDRQENGSLAVTRKDGKVRLSGVYHAYGTLFVIDETVSPDTPVLLEAANTGQIERLIEGYRLGAVRVNGVKLAVAAATKGDEILLHWSLDYTGPRQPLHILKPSLTEFAAAGQTTVLFFLIQDGKDYVVSYAAQSAFPHLWIGNRTPKEAYLAVERGKAGKGSLSASAGELWRAAKERFPGKFKEFPAALYVQLRYSPTDRGEEHALDAWTGSLQTELVPVPLKGVVPDPPVLPRP